MKKLLALLLALTMILTLAACGKKTEETPEQDPAVEEEAPLPEEEDVVIEPEVADPEENVPAEPTEEPDVAPEMPTVGEETEETPEQKPVEESKPEQKPEEKPQEPAPEAPAAGSVDLTAFYTSLVNTYGENFPANMSLTEVQEMLDAFYPGLSAIDTKQMLIYQPMMGAVVCEIALIEVANAADVETVKSIVEGRITAQVDGGAWYPESIEGWKNNSRVVVNGNCVMMIAYSECDAVVSAFNGLFA